MAKNRDLEGFEEEVTENTHKMRTNHLLVIGIDNYKNSITDLNNAVLDAQTVTAILQEKYDFKPENTTIILNERATREAIISAFDKKMETLTEDDNFVFYFSGHGEIAKRGNRGFWIPADGKVGKRSSWVSNSDIKETLASTHAHHILGIVDSCFSGSFFRNLTQENTPNHTYQLLDSTPSRWLLTAGRETLVPDGAPGEHSPFARVLISHLKNNPLSALPISELAQKIIFAPSINSVNAKPRGEALNIQGSDGGQFIFYKKDFTPKESTQATTSVKNRNIDTPKEEISRPTPTPIVKEVITNANLDEHLKKLVRLGDTEKAFDLLNKKINPDSRIANDLTLVQARYNHLARKKQNGLITDEYFSMSNARITHSLISTIDNIDEEDLL